MAGQDVIDIEVLADGTLKITTNKVSPANHMNAEQLLKGIETLTGGASERHRKGHTHIGEHEHEHEHEHEKH